MQQLGARQSPYRSRLELVPPPNPVKYSSWRTNQIPQWSVSEEWVQTILQAGRQAPSAQEAPFHLILIDQPHLLERLAAVAGQVGPARGFGVVVLAPCSCAARLDVGQVVEHMALAGWALGLQSRVGHLADAEKARFILGYPEELEAVSYLCFDEEAEPRGRRRFEVIHRNAW